MTGGKAKEGYGEINVSDIAQKALINRKIFYARYAGVHETITGIRDEITASLQALPAQKRFVGIWGNYLMSATDC